MKKCLCLLCISLSFSVFADVFTLWPYGGKGGSGTSGNGTASSLQTVLGGRALKAEAVNINGENFSLGISLLDRDLDECIKILKSAYKDARFRANDDSVLVELADPAGGKMRIYLIATGGDEFKVIQFSMKVPDKLPPPTPWPQELPILPSSTPLTYMKLPSCGGSYGAFNSLLPPDAAFAELKKSLKANGWTSFNPSLVSTPSRGSGTSFGELFSKEKSSSLMTVSVSALADGNGSSIVIYTRPATASR